MSEPPNTVTVAAVQSAAFQDVEANAAAAVDAIGRAADGGAKLVVLQELFAGRYFCQSEDHAAFDLAEPIPGPTSRRIAAAAEEHGVVVVASLFERRAPGLTHNTAVVFDADGSTAGVYRKMHIPDDPLYYEKFFFTPGDAATAADPDAGFAAFDTAVGRVGVIVCWDQWFPEAARLTALAGAEFLCVPTAIGWHPCERQSEGPAQLDAWQTVQRSHAIANGVFLIAANRCGHEPTPGDAGGGIDFWGHSFVCGPDGRVLVEADEEPGIVTAECDRSAIRTQRQNWPFLRDRRVDAYGGLLRRWGQR